MCYGDSSAVIGFVGKCWDDANNDWKVNPDACIDQALHDFCGVMEVTEVVDPTDQADVTGSLWNIPAMLIDTGVIAQLGEPLLVANAYIAQSTTPTGLLQEFASDLRVGAMVFNEDGSKSECTQPDPHILYSCADAANRDGGENHHLYRPGERSYNELSFCSQ